VSHSTSERDTSAVLLKFRQTSFATIIVIVCGSAIMAQSPLTPILDNVLYNNKPFNGTIHVIWQGLSQVSNTPQFSMGVTDGHLSMSIPSSDTFGPASDYFVSYSLDDGTGAWTELWVVPVSTSPLTVSQVRIFSSVHPSQSPSSADTIALPISIDEVTNLSADLAVINSQITPLGPANASTTAINTIVAGLSTNVATLTAQVASLSATISTLGGPNGNTISTMPAFVDAEVPAGKIDGKNLSFSVANQPNPPTSLVLFKNGVRMVYSVDFTLLGSTITFANTTVAPHVGDSLVVMYRF
jgi:hypothetical protein